LLAGVLPQCRVLRVLDCEKCILGLEGSELLAPGLGTCSTLETLSTAECLIRSDGVLKLAPALQSCHALTSLDMSKNQIGALGVDTLTRCLRQCPSLAHLKLSSNQLGEDGCNNIARNLQLPYYTALVGLDISLNDVGDRGAVRVGLALDALASSHSGLVQLNLAYNQLSAAVSAVVLSSARFSVLRMCHNHLLPHFTLEMREGLERSVGLQELCLSACNIQGHLPQFASVLQAMGACPNLQVLDLSSNHAISDEGVEALAAGLEGSRELRIMSLECCGIGDRGALALAAAMRRWVRLEHLLLKNNGISDVGAEAMASLLLPRCARHSRRGKEDDTDKATDKDKAKDKQREPERGNAAPAEYGGAPTGAPGKTPSHHVQGLQLQHLDLEANHVQDDGALAFAAALRQGKTRVRLVNLSRNFISCKCVQGLQDRFVEVTYGGQTDDGDVTHDSHVHLQERAQQVPLLPAPPPRPILPLSCPSVSAAFPKLEATATPCFRSPSAPRWYGIVCHMYRVSHVSCFTHGDAWWRAGKRATGVGRAGGRRDACCLYGHRQTRSLSCPLPLSAALTRFQALYAVPR
jgi:Ran GTPase-activating protein (RanGAP) involved in mRNA processing and transport